MKKIWNGFPLFFILFFLNTHSLAQKKSPVVPSLTPSQKDTDGARLTKEAAAESLITQAEEKALQTLESILKRSQGSAQEPDLWMRRGELYMRRAKSARFFEFQREDLEKSIRFVPEEIKNQQARKHLIEANKSYFQVFSRFKNYTRSDQALYTFSYNLEQLGDQEKALIYYNQLITDYQKSSLLSDALLSLGEIYYQKSNFEKALQNFEKIGQFKNSKAYWYAEYKKGWVFYNTKEYDLALSQMTLIIKRAPQDGARLSLRDEALKDSALFYAESHPPHLSYSHFSKLTENEDELISSLLRLSDLYTRHSKYKDAEIVYNEILKIKKSDAIRVQVFAKQANTQLNEKNFLEASQTLNKLALSCEKINNKASQCDIDLSDLQTKVIKNIWVLYKKNPNDSPLSKELENQIKIAANSSISPENKSKFISLLGDFYFEGKKYNEAGRAYFESHKIKPTEKSLLAAIDSLTLSKTNSQLIRKDQLSYIDLYLEQYSKGEQNTNLRIKKIALHLESKETIPAKEQLAQLEKTKDLSNQQKEIYEDLYLDYLNQIKDYETLRKVSKEGSLQSKNEKRKLYFSKLYDEITVKVSESNLQGTNDKKLKKENILSLAQVAISSKTLDKNTKKSTLLLSIQEAYKNNFYQLSTKLSEDFIKEFPNDPEIESLVRSNFKLAFEIGDLQLAKKMTHRLLETAKGKEKSQLVRTLLEIEQTLLSPKELLVFINKYIKELTIEDQKQLFTQLWNTAFESNDSVQKSWLQNKVEELKIEPLLSQIQLVDINQLIEQKKYSEAFQKSKKFMSPDRPKEIRSKARLIQALVFEKELYEVGRKSTLDRLPTVLSIKTERLEKVQKAFEEVTALSNQTSPEHLNSQLGVDRTLAHYLNYLDNLEIKNLTEESDKNEVTQLKEALSSPIKKKLEDTRTYISKIKKSSQSQASFQISSFNFDLNPSEFTLAPIITNEIQNIFPPLNLSISENNKISNFSLTSNCQSESNDLQSIQNCLLQNTTPANLSLLFQKLDGEILPPGHFNYLQSQMALNQKKYKEALFQIQLALSANPKEPHYLYQKGRILLSNDQISGGLDYLNQSYLLGVKLKTLEVISVIDGYIQNNCYRSLAFSESINQNKNTINLLTPIVSECHAQTQDYEKAQQSIKKLNELGFYHLLQLARINEEYLKNTKESLVWYQKSIDKTQNQQAKVWISKKINWLKTQDNSVKSEKKLRIGQEEK